MRVAAEVLAAARAVAAVASGGRSADDAGRRRGRAAPAIRAVALGTLRHALRLEPPLGVLLADGGALRAHVLLARGLHQLEYSRNPREATVSQAVDAARLLRQGAPRGW
ncbi:MAG: hypothetical protein U1F06_05315 [Steroidobacteraceae bacterium]